MDFRDNPVLGGNIVTMGVRVRDLNLNERILRPITLGRVLAPLLAFILGDNCVMDKGVFVADVVNNLFPCLFVD